MNFKVAFIGFCVVFVLELGDKHNDQCGHASKRCELFS